MNRLAFLAVLVALAAGGAAGALYLRTHEPYRGFQVAEQFVDIPQGAGSRTIGDRLVAGGVVRDTVTFRASLWLSGQGRRLKAGEYRFTQAATPFEVIDKLARGDVYVIKFAVPEGLTMAEMAALFEMHGFGPAASFVAAASDPAPIRALDPAARDLEGYLFPDTYPLTRHTTASELVHLMVAQFLHEFTPAIRQAAEAHGMTPRQAVTVASIVEKETAKPEERPVVAAVYENRLRIGMALQCDPTVVYALTRAGIYDGNLRRDDLQFDSPYNTYRYPGLPPGPIASPGRAALEASVGPADVDFLYFVSRNDGSHVFARDLADHNRNVQKFQVEYFKQQRAGKGGTGR
jgi:UPF0755 protein